MDADLDTSKQEGGEEWDGSEEMRKRKLDEYMEELYKLEFNDLVCSFLLFTNSQRNEKENRSVTNQHDSHTPQSHKHHTTSLRLKSS
jgi:hypothetical protein